MLGSTSGDGKKGDGAMVGSLLLEKGRRNRTRPVFSPSGVKDKKNESNSWDGPRDGT